MKILNKYYEALDVLIEGNNESSETIIFAHGFGTNKNEGGKLFLDISNILKEKFRIIRFDFSGYGESEGNQEGVNLHKQAEDLESILNYTKSNYSGKVSIIAHSMGTYVTCLLSPDGINKTIFTGMPNTDMTERVKDLQKRIINKGGFINEQGISSYPRSNGSIQKLGASFWSAMREFQPAEALKNYSKKTSITIFKPMQDEIIGNESFEEYKNIPNVNFVELTGDHNFTNQVDREVLIKKIVEVLG
ncbi:MAG: alpha/beta hydrolase [bacterium]